MMNKMTLARKVLTCLTLLLLVGGFDYLTGYEVSSFPLYLLPIMLTFFYLGRGGAYVACVAATVIWTVTDIADGHTFSREVFRYWNMLARLFVYILMVYGLSLYVKTVAANRQRLDDLRRLVPMCHGCGKILCPDGVWRSAKEFLERPVEDLPECPACVAIERSQSAH